jgi:hypothetical protein
MLSEPDRVEYIQWTDASGQLSGQFQVARLPDSGAYTVLTQNFPFTGTHSGTNISLSVDQGGHTAVTFTGSLVDDTLQLVSPAASGLLQTKTYHLTTVDGYNQATIAFKSAVKARADVTTADAALSTALQKLHTDVGTLTADTKFDDATKNFDPDFSSLQSAFQAAQAAGQQPFDCARTNDLANARSAVNRWQSAIQADARNLSTMESKVSSDGDSVSTDISSAKALLQTLQTAIQVPVAAGVDVKTSPSDVTSATTDAQTQLDASHAASDSAQSRYGDYLNRANDADNQAASLVSQLTCPPATPQPPQPVTVASGQSNSPPPPPPAPSSGSLYAVVVAPDGVNVRSQPGSADRVGCLTQGAVVRLTEGPRSAGSENWYYAHDFGWIAGAYSIEEWRLRQRPPATRLAACSPSTQRWIATTCRPPGRSRAVPTRHRWPTTSLAGRRTSLPRAASSSAMSRTNRAASWSTMSWWTPAPWSAAGPSPGPQSTRAVPCAWTTHPPRPALESAPDPRLLALLGQPERGPHPGLVPEGRPAATRTDGRWAYSRPAPTGPVAAHSCPPARTAAPA